MAGPGSGLGSSLGSGIEAAGSYGVAVTPNLWLASDSADLKQNPVFFDGKGLRGGTLVTDVNDHILTNLDAAGTIKTPVYYRGIGRYIASLQGSLNASGAPVDIGSTSAYIQTHAFQNGWNQSLTLQQGIPDVNQTVHNWLTVGAKVIEGAFECAAGSDLNATFTIDARDRYESATAITTPVEPTGDPFFAWQNMSVRLGAFGSEVSVDGVSKWTGTIKRQKADKRFNAGNFSVAPNMPATGPYAVKSEPVDNGFAAISCVLETEYLNDTLYENYYLTQTPFSLIVSFVSSTYITTGATPTNPYSITFAFPSCRFKSSDPQVSGPDIVKPQMNVEVFNDEVHAPCTVTIVSTEVAL